MQITIIILATVLSTTILGAAAVFIWNTHKKRFSIWSEAASSAKALNEIMRANAEAMTTVPALLEGLKKIAGEQVVQINMLRNEITQFRKMMFRKEEVRGVQNPTEDEKGYWYEAQRLMAENPMMSREEALQKVIESMSVSSVNEFSL